MVGKVDDLSDPIPRLEWMGVERFVAGDHVSSVTFFAQARELVLLRLKEQGCSDSKRTVTAAAATVGIETGFDWTAGSGDLGAGLTDGFRARGDFFKGRNSKESKAGEFHPDAMRLDRCMAVAICREGPDAF